MLITIKDEVKKRKEKESWFCQSLKNFQDDSGTLMLKKVSLLSYVNYIKIQPIMV